MYYFVEKFMLTSILIAPEIIISPENTVYKETNFLTALNVLILIPFHNKKISINVLSDQYLSIKHKYSHIQIATTILHIIFKTSQQ